MSNNNIDEFVVSIKLETDKLNQSFANLSSKFDNLGKDISTRFDKSFSEKKLARSLDKSKNVFLLKDLSELVLLLVLILLCNLSKGSHLSLIIYS